MTETEEEAQAETLSVIISGVELRECPSCQLFAVYRLDASLPKSDDTADTGPWHIWRRYSEFSSFDRMVRSELTVALPPLPPKRLRSSIDPDVVEERVRGLGVWLHALVDAVLHHRYQGMGVMSRLLVFLAPPVGHHVTRLMWRRSRRPSAKFRSLSPKSPHSIISLAQGGCNFTMIIMPRWLEEAR